MHQHQQQKEFERKITTKHTTIHDMKSLVGCPMRDFVDPTNNDTPDTLNTL
jgi:hypothetical protein